MDPLIIPIVGMLIPIIIVPTALGIKHARYLRQIEHAERMRALELGHPPVDEHSWTPAGLAGSIGAGVPIAAMGIAFVATRSMNDPGSLDGIIQMAAMIGVAGVICGTILAALQMSKTGQNSIVSKPSYDPDAFDVVGSRG